MALDIADDISASSSGPAKRILVVDDDEDFRMCLEQAIRKQGFEVHCVDDGSMAAIRICESRPDLIVTDLMMPGVGGLELIRSLAEGGFAEIPILVVTACAVDEQARTRLMSQAKVVEIIQKPPNVLLLVETLHRALNIRKQVFLDLDVMLVDDSATQRFHLKSLLEGEHCRCWEATDGKHALETLKSYQPDAMILDFTMPHLDGFGLLRVMQADPTLSNIPIIVLTGKIMNKAARSEIEMEANVKRVLSKPPDLPSILEVLRQIAVGKHERNH